MQGNCVVRLQYGWQSKGVISLAQVFINLLLLSTLWNLTIINFRLFCIFLKREHLIDDDLNERILKINSDRESLADIEMPVFIKANAQLQQNLETRNKILDKRLEKWVM